MEERNRKITAEEFITTSLFGR